MFLQESTTRKLFGTPVLSSRSTVERSVFIHPVSVFYQYQFLPISICYIVKFRNFWEAKMEKWFMEEIGFAGVWFLGELQCLSLSWFGDLMVVFVWMYQILSKRGVYFILGILFFNVSRLWYWKLKYTKHYCLFKITYFFLNDNTKFKIWHFSKIEFQKHDSVVAKMR